MPQGTVKSFDDESGTAVILDDRLAEREVDAEAVAASGLRLLRVGQRVRFEIEEDPQRGARVTNLDIVSL